ncbi:MAG TPA: hypothetical protein ENI62_15960 [Gammaproteobacteria bacterium]|nr:hypothetical protein [Gammaproteobacteria bacterium]
MCKAFIRLLMLSAILFIGPVSQQAFAHGPLATDAVVDNTALVSSNLYSSSTARQALRRLLVRTTVSPCCDRPTKSQSGAGHCDSGHCNDASQLLPVQGDMGFLALAKLLVSPSLIPLIAAFSTVKLRPPPQFS